MFGKILKRKSIIKLKTILSIKKYVKYLGIILNQKLNFFKYIYTCLKKAKTQFNMILTLETDNTISIQESPSEDVQDIFHNTCRKPE